MRHRIALVVVALLVWIAGSTLGTVSRSGPARAAPLFRVGRAHAETVPTLEGKKPIFILALGSDARPGTPVARGLSDSIHMIGINPAKKSATILGFPRDSWVAIPGRGAQKINNAMVLGGPQLTIQTLEDLTGIQIDYYALTSFDGIKAMIKGIGGLVVNVPYPMNDPYARAQLQAGTQRLTGKETLAFSRTRHDTPNGDFSRSENQGRVFMGALTQFRKEFTQDPSRLLTWLGSGLQNLETDLPLQELTDLAFTAYQIKPANVKNLVVPGSTGMEGTQSVVYISPAANAIYADMAKDGLVGGAPGAGGG